MFPGVGNSSDGAESVGAEADLIIGFDHLVETTDVQTASIIYSTRSRSDFDCGSFCKSNGGGGHTKAAGFAVKFPAGQPFPDPYTLLASILNTYETGLVG